jgi:hypothetical protein
MGPDPDGNINQWLKLTVPPGGEYTDLVIKAYTGATNQSCRELSESGEAGTACTILAVDPERGTPAIRRRGPGALSRSSSPR